MQPWRDDLGGQQVKVAVSQNEPIRGSSRWRGTSSKLPRIAAHPGARIDCILLVAAMGMTKASEIEECNRHLQSSDVVRLVLNKATDAVPNYYY
jgi:hypothetical protein